MGQDLGLNSFRRRARWATLLSLGLTVGAIYFATQKQWPIAGTALVLGILVLYWVGTFTIRTERGSERELIFVTKQQCSLCEEAAALLPGIMQGTQFRLRTADIAEHRWLCRQFKTKVPVLLWQGEIVAQLRFDPGAVRQRLMDIESRTGLKTA